MIKRRYPANRNWRMCNSLARFKYVAILLHMRKELTKEKQVLDLARKAKILRVQDLAEKGIHPEHLRRLYQRGLLVRMGRGVYMLPNARISGNFSFAEVAKKVP